MQTSYQHKKTITITLELEVYDDSYYRNLDFDSLLELEGDEHLEVSITDYSELEVIWINNGAYVPIVKLSTKSE